MELDELKYQLKNKLATDHTGRSDEDIASLLTKKTSSVIGKLKRSLWIEMICCVLVIIAFGYLGFFSKTQSFRIYFSVFTVVSIAFLCLLFYLLKKISVLGSSALPVKNNLQTIVNIIEEFMKRYFQFILALIPICLIFSFLLGYTEPQQTPEIDRLSKHLFSSAWQVIIFLIIYLLILSVGIYYFTKWYLKKFYGNYVVKLKECIQELGEE